MTDNHGVSWIRPFIVALSRWPLLAVVLACSVSSGVQSQVLTLRDAQVTTNHPMQSVSPAWRAQSLPDDWARTRPDYGGELWYRLELHFDEMQGISQVPALYVARVCSNLAIYLNGSLVGTGGRLTPPYTRNCFTPQLFNLPQPLLKAGVNTLDVQVVGYPLRQISAAQRSAGLSELMVGPLQQLKPLYEQASWWNITLPKIITALLGAFTLFIGALWLARPQDRYYGYFTLWIGWWTLNTTRLYLTDLPVAGPWLEMLVPATSPLCAMGIILFLMRFAGRDVRWVNRLVWGQAVVIPLMFLIGGWDHIYTLARVTYGFMIPQFMAFALWFLIVSWKESRRDFWIFSVILFTLIGMALVELAAAFLQLPLKSHIGHLGGPITLMPLCLRLIWVFSDNLRRSEQLNTELERRVAEKSSEIERSYAELADLRAREAAQQERRRIASDLHDDLGARLMSIAHASRTEGDRDALAGMARQALDDMRLSVRGMVSEPVSAGNALADWRAESMQRLTAAGFEVDWQADEPPDRLILPARVHLQMTRVLREAISNVIRHSGGHRCQIQIDFPNEGLRLVVQDDGCGFDPEAVTQTGKGHGLNGMESRVRKLGGRQCWQPTTSGGAKLDVWVPMEALPEDAATGALRN